MKQRRWIRALALCLSLMLLAGVASAATYTVDLSGDGKVNVWDLQLAVNQSKEAAHQTAILEEILGSPDELHKNAEGVYEIYSPLGLYNMAKLADKGYTFKLMRDVDMDGANWTPIAGFQGKLIGNLHTVSNFRITKAVSGEDGASMGFIGSADQAVVKDLNLKDVTLVVPTEPEANVCYIGLIAGFNGGSIENCTTEGLVIDQRTELTAPSYIGTLVGRNGDSGAVVSGTNTLTATAGSPNSDDKVEGVTSKLAMEFAEVNGDNTRHIGIVGCRDTGSVDTTMIWQDVSSDFSRLSATERTRRQTVVDEMYKMGSVQWTTSELLTYTTYGNKTATSSNIYIPGTTYYGIPYNGGGGGYERAMSLMQPEKDDQGRYVTVTGLENGEKSETGVFSGFATTMGNDCVSSVAWSWAKVTPHRVLNNGTHVHSTAAMVPNDYNIATYGILPAGGYPFVPGDLEKYPGGQDARDTQAIIALNGGAQGMAEYYAKANRGDALMCVKYTLNTTTNEWVKHVTHARMLAYEPVIIRDHKGDIDVEASYVITHEQGDGLFDNRNASGAYDKVSGYNLKQTSWRLDHKYSLKLLLTEEGFTAAKNTANHPGCGWGYVPVTMPAFKVEGEMRQPYYDPGYINENNYHPVILPDSGWYYSNWKVVSATMIITDAEGSELYSKTSFPTVHYRLCHNVKLEELFPDSAQGLTAGQTYYCTLKIQASNGTWYTKLNNQAFTYDPTT